MTVGGAGDPTGQRGRGDAGGSDHDDAERLRRRQAALVGCLHGEGGGPGGGRDTADDAACAEGESGRQIAAGNEPTVWRCPAGGGQGLIVGGAGDPTGQRGRGDADP